MNSDLPRPSGTATDHEAILVRVARDNGLTKPTEIIWAALREAAGIVTSLPDRERQWQRAGRQSNWQSHTGMSQSEAQHMERHRTLAGLMAGDPITFVRTPGNSEQSLLTLEWLRFLRSARDADRLSSAAMVLLSGDDRQAAAQIYRPNRKPVRQTTYEIKRRVTDLVALGLRQQFGLYVEHVAERPM